MKMKQEFAKFMKYGKRVRCNGEIFFLVANAGSDSNKVKAIAEENKRRYEMLRAWSRNHVGVTPEQKAEMLGYEKELSIATIEPDNMVRFITPEYKTKFEVRDLSEIRFNDKVKTVVYIDEYHFTFTDGAGFFGCYHICQFAELCEQNVWSVEPIGA